MNWPRRRMCEGSLVAGLKARDMTAQGNALGQGYQIEFRPEGAEQECVCFVTAFQASVVLRDNNLGLRSSDSLQPRLSQDGLSALEQMTGRADEPAHRRMRERATLFAGLQARDVKAWGEAPGSKSQNEPSPEGAGHKCVDSVATSQASPTKFGVICNP